MRAKANDGNRRTLKDEFPIAFKNTSSETVPPFAVMQVASATGIDFGEARLVSIVKPTGSSGQYLFNGPGQVKAGKKGRGRAVGVIKARISGTAEHGDTVGPSNGSWEVSESESNWPVYGGAGDDYVLLLAGGGGEDHIPEFVAVITEAIDAGDGPPTPGSPGAGTGAIYRIGQGGLSDLASYFEVTDFSEVLPVPANTHAEPAILNPHRYAAQPGIYPVEFVGTMLNGVFGDPDPEDTDPYAVFSITDHDLLSFAEGAAAPFLLGKDGSTLRWVDLDEYEGYIPVPGPPGADGEDGATTDGGYCITAEADIETEVTTLHHDAITTDAGTPATGRDLSKLQVWVHFAGATAYTDAQWKSLNDYDADAPLQLLGNFDGSWDFATLDNYDELKIQLFGHNEGDWDAKTIADWLKLLPGWDADKDQSIGHDAAGNPMWQDDGDCD